MVIFSLLASCKEKEPEITQILVGSTAINKTFSEVRHGNLILDKGGEENVSWTVSTNKI